MKPILAQRIVLLIGVLLFATLGILWYIQSVNDNARPGTTVEMIEAPSQRATPTKAEAQPTPSTDKAEPANPQSP